LKFIFKKGYADFITVHKLNVTGDPLIESVKEKPLKSKSKSENKAVEDVKDKILVRQSVDSSTSIKINKPNSNSSSMVDVNSSKHNKKSTNNDDNDNNLTDIATELQSSHISRRESRKLSKVSSHSNESGHHSKSKKSSSLKLKENTNTDDS